MSSNFRGVLLASAAALTAILMTSALIQGSDWIIQLSILLFGMLLALVFIFLTISKDNGKGSTPLSNKSSSNSVTIENGHQDLPDPSDSGFDLPLM